MQSLTAACLGIYTCVADTTAVDSIVGLAPDKVALYESNIIDGQFHCLRGTRVISASHINDGYCDCPDGSDEPGTSACSYSHPNAAFHCRNSGYYDHGVPASRVNDGVCDCCDGSDEWDRQKFSKCRNSCAEKAREVRAQIDGKVKEINDGLTARAKLKDVGSRKHTSIDRDISHLEENIKALELQKQTIELQLNRFHEAQNATQQQESAETEVGGEEPAVDAGRSLESPPDEVDSPEQVSEYAKWMQQDPASSDDQTSLHDHAEPSYDPFTQQQLTVGDTHGKLQRYLARIVDMTRTVPVIGRALKWLMNVPPTEDELLERSQALDKDIEGKWELIERMRNAVTAYGEGPEMFAIALECYSYSSTADGYTYNICPYHKATQLFYGTRYSLGVFANVTADHTKMYFHKGDDCFNGLQRSLEVEVSCATKTEVISLVEVSTCVYRGEMTSPVACSERHQTVLQDMLKGFDEL